MIRKLRLPFLVMWVFMGQLLVHAQPVKQPVIKKDTEVKTEINLAKKKAVVRKELKILLNTPPLADIQGNKYKTIKIGSQTWMKENLRSTRLNDSSAIENVTDNAQWITRNGPAYAWYNNDSGANASTNGALYNWFAASSGKLCPAGWHVPKLKDWDTLVNYLGGDSIAGDKLKSITGWLNTQTATPTDVSHFTALPAGWRQHNGLFIEQGKQANYWTSMQYGSVLYGFYYGMDAYRHGFWRSYQLSTNGLSVRCIKD